jgi:hypothetical protein
LPACSDAGLTPSYRTELPMPRLIIAPPVITVVAACTSVTDVSCALLNWTYACIGSNPVMVCESGEWLFNANSSGSMASPPKALVSSICHLVFVCQGD